MEITQQSDICSRCICCDSQLCLQFIVCDVSIVQHKLDASRGEGEAVPFSRLLCPVLVWVLMNRCTLTVVAESLHPDSEGLEPEWRGRFRARHPASPFWWAMGVTARSSPVQRRTHASRAPRHAPAHTSSTDLGSGSSVITAWLAGWMVAGISVLPWPAATW